MNNIPKFFGVLAVLGCIITPAVAEDDVVTEETTVQESRVVGARTDCDAIKAEIESLNKTEDPDDAIFSRIEELQVILRRDCAKATNRRRAMGRGGKMNHVIAAVEAADAAAAADQETVVVSDTTVVAAQVTTTDITQMDCNTLVAQIDALRATDATANAAQIDSMAAEYDARCGAANVAVTAAEIKELIAAGLCADGSEPNQYGCCGDEKFKDLGNNVFGCCPADGGDCFPPITKQGE